MAAMRKTLVVVGDSFSGKTNLLTVFISGNFEEDSPPTIIEQYEAQIVVDGSQIDLSLLDTPGEEINFCRFEYTDADLILICFAIDNPVSLHNVQYAWKPEVQRHYPGVPIVLVGNKKDLRDNPETIKKLALNMQEPVSFKEGEDMVDKINAYAYLECSAKSKEGIKEVFETATLAALKNDARSCCFPFVRFAMSLRLKRTEHCAASNLLGVQTNRPLEWKQLTKLSDHRLAIVVLIPMLPRRVMRCVK